jgi:hypothetical protein
MANPYELFLMRNPGFARYLEPALAVGSSALAEPISGVAGLGQLAFGGSADDAANRVKQIQELMRYSPVTQSGNQGLQAVQQFMQPIADVVQGASQNLGDKAYGATGSPALAAAAYSAPTAMLEALGLKGLSIAKSPVKAADLYSARMGMGAVDEPITSIHQLFDLSPSQLASQLQKSDPSKLTESGAWRAESNRFYTDYLADGSAEMRAKDGKLLKRMEPDDARRMFRERILEAERQKPEVAAIIAENQQRDDLIAASQRQQSESDYRMQHRAPTKAGGNPAAYDLSSVFDDIYGADATRLNGTGASFDKRAISIIQSIKGKPDAEIEIFRAVPSSVKSINSGDWVTTTKEYAEQHMGDAKGWHILSKKVKAKDVATDGNSIHEFGYDPGKE